MSVLFVLVQHVTGTTRWYAGAAGVALFFALSGYLITGLLLDELERRGSVSLRRFYLRRSARLVPGLLVMLVAASCLLVSVGAASYLSGVVPAATYLSNYTSILAGPDHLNLVFGHAWSLAVEEHFYLGWPLLLVVLHRRLGPGRLLWATLGLCALALTYRSVLQLTIHPSSYFFYVDSLSRADSILFGAAACIAVRQGWRPGGWQKTAAVALFGGYLAADPVLIDGVLGSLVSGSACAVLVAAVDNAPAGSTLRRALTARPFRGPGKRSYGIYLWHLPMIGYAVALTGQDSLGVRLVAALVCLPVANASYRWVETPVRNAVRRRTDTPKPGTPTSAINLEQQPRAAASSSSLHSPY